MRPRTTIILVALSIMAVGVYTLYWNSKKDEDTEQPKQQPLSQGANTGAFNQSFDRLLSAYYSVKDALVASDTVKANKAAVELQMAADSLKVDEIQGDTSGTIKETALSYTGTIIGSAKGFVGETTIDEKRKEFEMLTEAMWNLSRVVKYGGRKIYYQYCPMAFNDKGAYWMSNEREIRNPYFGDQMLECGKVEDSLDYSKKN